MEVLIAGAVASIIATAFLVVFSSFSSGVALEEARASALREVQAASAELSTGLRQAVALELDGPTVVSLQGDWASAEIIFYSDRFPESPGPERYRYYVDGCSGNLCNLMRDVTEPDTAVAPWTFTGTPTTERLVSNILNDGGPMFQGADWSTGSEVLTSSCDAAAPCVFASVQITIRVDPEPNVTAERPLQVRHEVRMRNAP